MRIACPTSDIEGERKCCHLMIDLSLFFPRDDTIRIYIFTSSSSYTSVFFPLDWMKNFHRLSFCPTSAIGWWRRCSFRLATVELYIKEMGRVLLILPCFHANHFDLENSRPSIKRRQGKMAPTETDDIETKRHNNNNTNGDKKNHLRRGLSIFLSGRWTD